MLIGELARRAHLSKDGIRHYEQLGLIKSVPRRAGSRIYRDYDPSTLKTIDDIRHSARYLGLSLKEIGPLLKSVAKNPPTRQEVVSYLEKRIVVIRERLASLQEVEDYISKKLERYRAEDEALKKRERRNGPRESRVLSSKTAPQKAAGSRG